MTFLFFCFSSFLPVLASSSHPPPLHTRTHAAAPPPRRHTSFMPLHTALPGGRAAAARTALAAGCVHARLYLPRNCALLAAGPAFFARTPPPATLPLPHLTYEGGIRMNDQSGQTDGRVQFIPLPRPFTFRPLGMNGRPAEAEGQKRIIGRFAERRKGGAGHGHSAGQEVEPLELD